MQHPDQPMYVDDSGVVRFRPNRLIQVLYELGRFDLNECAVLAQTRGDITADDELQLAQLVGYSVDGFCNLSYAEYRADELWQKAADMVEKKS